MTLSLEELQNEPVRVHCPIRGVIEIAPPDVAEIAPLVAHLQANQPVAEPTSFPRGTVLEDGRLDLCKQHLGALGCRMVTDALTVNTTITSLLLGTDGIGDGGAADVARLIERNTHLEIVYLGCNFISETGAAKLSASLARNTSVTGLWLKRNPLGANGVQHVAEMLWHNNTLRVLDLVNTELDEEGLSAIVLALVHKNYTLQRLYLGGNGIGPSSAKELRFLLCTPTSLKALFLNVNQLEDAGVAILAEGLQQNATLEELGLGSNNIGPEGMAALLPALRVHPVLRDLDLGYSASTQVLGAQGNHIGDAGVIQIAEWLRDNPPLRRLNLRGNGIGLAGRAALHAALETNTNLLHLALDTKHDAHTDSLNALLERNRAQNSEADTLLARDITLIRSVYRTVPAAISVPAGD